MGNNIIILSDIYKLREDKQRELLFYRKKLEELQLKMAFLQRELQLTNHIIGLIEKEKVVDVSKKD